MRPRDISPQWPVFCMLDKHKDSAHRRRSPHTPLLRWRRVGQIDIRPVVVRQASPRIVPGHIRLRTRPQSRLLLLARPAQPVQFFFQEINRGRLSRQVRHGRFRESAVSSAGRAQWETVVVVVKAATVCRAAVSQRAAPEPHELVFEERDSCQASDRVPTWPTEKTWH